MTDLRLAGRGIVVGVDGSRSCLDAARWAAAEAARLNVPIHLLHAITPPKLAYDDGLGPELDSEIAAEVDGMLRIAGEVVRRVAPGVEVDATRVSRDPISALVTASESARMVALGSRGLGGFTGMLIGSIAVGVTAHGHCPVAVVRGAEARTGPVVVGVDGSPCGEEALAVAFEEASLRGTELVATHAWSDIPAASYAAANRTPERWDADQVAAEEVLAERLAGYREKYPDVTVIRSVSQDQPVANLLAHAAAAQLLVVGSRGRGAFGGLLLGSVSQAMIYHAPCPVLVVHQRLG